MIFKKTQIFILSLFLISFILLFGIKTNTLNIENINFNKNIIQENNVLSSIYTQSNKITNFNNLDNLDNLDIKLNKKSNLFFIAINFKKINKENNIKKIIKQENNFYIESNNKRYNLELDLDEYLNKKIIKTEDKLYFKPVFLKDTKHIKILIKNTKKLENTKNILNNIQVTALDLDKKEINNNLIKSIFQFKKIKALGSIIVSREEWGANPELIYRDSDIWKKKLGAYSSNSSSSSSSSNKLTSYQKKQKRIKEIFWNDNYDYAKSSKVEYYESGRKLVWPREYMEAPTKIVVHHTASIYDEDRSDKDIIRGIYYYHSISRQWGDIGYNYLVGRDGTIYEGRGGGELVIGAHAKWNNRHSIGISLLGNFEQEEVRKEQVKGLIYLIKDLSNEYNIDLEGKSIAFRECNSEYCKEPLEKLYTSNLIGHRDIGHTSCPGENIYEILDIIKNKANNFDPELLEKYLKEKEKKKQEYNLLKKFKETLDNEKIKIKLNYKSKYGNNNFIAIKPLDSNNYNKNNNKIKLSFKKNNKTITSREISKELNFSIKDNKIALHLGKYIIPISKQLKISGDILEIKSWDRKPVWDHTNKYNDNKFRGNIILTILDGKLVVINELDLHSYLKGLGEVGNRDNSEKSKAIIVSARTYAKYYLNKDNRKFNTDLYDGSDNPDEFQKYLGYEFEKRANSVTKLVNETRGEVIKYNGKIIKPWYFSSSNGQTKSFLDYCKAKGGGDKCRDIPYLQSVNDKGSEGLKFKGHGVGLSGTGAEFLARQGKDYKEILKYFYTGINIELEKDYILYLKNILKDKKRDKNIKNAIGSIDNVQRDLFEM